VLIFYGVDYTPVIFAVRLFLPLIFIKAIYNTPAIFLQNVYGKVRYINYGVLLLIAVNIIGCLTLIPLYGMIGAIFAHMAAYMVYLIWFYLSAEIQVFISKRLVYEMAMYCLFVVGWIIFSHGIVHIPAIASAILIGLAYVLVLIVKDDFGLVSFSRFSRQIREKLLAHFVPK